MSHTLQNLANFAIFATFLAAALSAVFTALYKWVVVPKLNGHIDTVVEPIKERLDEILRNGHQDPENPSIRDQLSTLVDLVGEHIKVADTDHARLQVVEEQVRALRAAS